MDPYSLLLALAMAAGALAVVLALLPAERRRTGFGRSAFPFAVASLLLALAALGVHLTTGHRPGTPDAMSLGRFVAEHPSLTALLLVAPVLVAWAKRRVAAR